MGLKANYIVLEHGGQILEPTLDFFWVIIWSPVVDIIKLKPDSKVKLLIGDKSTLSKIGS